MRLHIAEHMVVSVFLNTPPKDHYDAYLLL
jgi:hypothetical protein